MDPTAPEDELLDPKQLAKFLGMSEITMYLWRKKGTGPPWVKLENGRIRYWRSEVEAWMTREGRPAA